MALQRRLVGRQIDLLDAFETGGVPALALPGRYVQAKLARGVPALAGEPVPLPVPVLTLAIRDACDALGTTALADAARTVTDAIGASRLNAATLLGAVFARDQGSVRLMSRAAGVPHEVVWLAADNALAPFAHVVMRRIPGADRWQGWARGRCPACSTWPVTAEILDSGPVLRCAFCAGAWRVALDRCVYCDRPDQWAQMPDVERPGRRLMMCGACQGYLKVIDAPALQPFPMPTITDLVTFDLDQAAIERGARKPPL